MLLRILCLLILLTSIINDAYSSYIKGTVRNELGEPLPFATIYVKNTTYGVTSNSNGEYFMELKPAEYTILFSYIGYNSKELPLLLTKKGKTINVILKESSTVLTEFEIVSNTKNKAKEIIAAVRKKRKVYLNASDPK